jgi:hypothetical protein
MSTENDSSIVEIVNLNTVRAYSFPSSLSNFNFEPLEGKELEGKGPPPQQIDSVRGYNYRRWMVRVDSLAVTNPLKKSFEEVRNKSKGFDAMTCRLNVDQRRSFVNLT